MIIRIQSAARADAARAADWYASCRSRLALEFLLELDAALDRAALAPAAYPLTTSGARRVLVRRFPYAVYFLAGPEWIEVVAVLHQHRAPGEPGSRHR